MSEIPWELLGRIDGKEIDRLDPLAILWNLPTHPFGVASCSQHLPHKRAPDLSRFPAAGHVARLPLPAMQLVCIAQQSLLMFAPQSRYGGAHERRLPCSFG